MKKCPFCAEDVQDAAIKCRYCGQTLGDLPPGTQAHKIVKRSAAATGVAALGGLVVFIGLWFCFTGYSEYSGVTITQNAYRGTILENDHDVNQIANNFAGDAASKLAIGALMFLFGVAISIAGTRSRQSDGQRRPLTRKSVITGVVVGAFVLGAAAVVMRGNSFRRVQTEIDLSKFGRINDDMTYAAVQAITGTPGRIEGDRMVGGYRVTTYVWQNKDGSSARVIFRNGKLETKTQAGLR